MIRRWLIPVLPAALLLSGCGRTDEGAVLVDFIDSADNLFQDGVRLSPGAQHLVGATGAGLVAFNAQGDVVPALADRWIVTDDGRTFIFRLRDGKWPDGRDITAESVRSALRRTIRGLDGTSLGLDLAPISSVRAMAGRVIEIRLSGPVPTLLQLLAQPELTLARSAGGDGSGEMSLRRNGDEAILAMKPPAERGVPEQEDWQAYVRQVDLRPANSGEAISRFDNGELDIVLGGQIGSLPLVDTGPLSRGTVRLEPAIGLFGLQVWRPTGLLETEQGREAIAMAIDRNALMAPFNISGWVPTTRVSAPSLPNDSGRIPERWTDLPIEEARSIAAGRVNAWRTAHENAEARLTLALAREPGLDVLFNELSRQLAAIGVQLVRVAPDESSDLRMIDRVARYAEARWFLNQFNCKLRQGVCSEEADQLVREAISAQDATSRDSLLVEAEARLTQANAYIPFGSPLRFSLVRSDVDGFTANQWAYHPLSSFAAIPR